MTSSFKTKVIAIAEVVIPSTAKNEELKNKFWKNFSYFFNDLDKDSASKLQLLTKAIASICFLYNFKSIEKLSLEKRETFLNKIHHFPVSKIVAGFTGLRNLMMVSFYSMEDTWNHIGYDGPIVKREIV